MNRNGMSILLLVPMMPLRPLPLPTHPSTDFACPVRLVSESKSYFCLETTLHIRPAFCSVRREFPLQLRDFLPKWHLGFTESRNMPLQCLMQISLCEKICGARAELFTIRRLVQFFAKGKRVAWRLPTVGKICFYPLIVACEVRLSSMGKLINLKYFWRWQENNNAHLHRHRYYF